MPNDNRTYYVICADNCKFESMTKEQIYEAIAEATGATPTHIDDAFITKIKEQNHNNLQKFWRGTQAEYNALTPAADTFYIITDDSYRNDVETRFTNIESRLASTVKNITLAASGWTGSTTPYSYTLTDALITATNIIEIAPPSDITSVQYNELANAQIIGGTQAAGSIILRAFGTKPLIDIPITVIFRKDL